MKKSYEMNLPKNQNFHKSDKSRESSVEELIFKMFFLMMVLLWSPLNAKEEAVPPPVDHIQVATILFYDGKYDKALISLQKAKESNVEIDWMKYHSMRGIIFLKQNRLKEAIEELRKAIEVTHVYVYKKPVVEEKPKHLFTLLSERNESTISKEPPFDPEALRKDKLQELYLYLSQAYYKDKQYLKTVEALDQAGERGRDSSATFTLRAECYWKADEKERAITVLTQGATVFPEDTTLLKQKFYYFAELQLYQAAIQAAREYIKRMPADEKEYVSLAQMLQNGGEKNQAIQVLEEAALRFPKSAKIQFLLGLYYNQKQMTYTAAHLLEMGAERNATYLKDAAEMYRRAGDLSYAIYLNSKMTDNAEKTRQKVAIFVSRGEFEKVIALKDALNRYGMLKDDNMRYALAYAYYVVHDFDKAEEHLQKIEDNELFSKATVIRKNIEKCKDKPMECIE